MEHCTLFYGSKWWSLGGLERIPPPQLLDAAGTVWYGEKLQELVRLNEKQRNRRMKENEE